MGWWTSRSMTTSAWMPVPAHLRTPHAEPAGLGRNDIPCARAASGGASPQGSRRITAPLSSPGWSPPCTSRGWQCPASCRDDRSTPDLLTSRHRPLPTGLVAPSNATGGFHGEYSRFPTVVPTHNIDGSHTSKYSCQYVRVKERALMERSSPCFT